MMVTMSDPSDPDAAEPLRPDAFDAECSGRSCAARHRQSNGAARSSPPDGSPVTVFTDGACAGNPGPGGWGWAVAPDGTPSGSGGDPSTTNQRMELQAVLEALRALGVGRGAGPVEVVSDSTYVVNCFRDKWWFNWQRNGWKNSKKQPVANADIWKPLVETRQQR